MARLILRPFRNNKVHKPRWRLGCRTRLKWVRNSWTTGSHRNMASVTLLSCALLIAIDVWMISSVASVKLTSRGKQIHLLRNCNKTAVNQVPYPLQTVPHLRSQAFNGESGLKESCLAKAKDIWLRTVVWTRDQPNWIDSSNHKRALHLKNLTSKVRNSAFWPSKGAKSWNHTKICINTAYLPFVF